MTPELTAAIARLERLYVRYESAHGVTIGAESDVALVLAELRRLQEEEKAHDLLRLRAIAEKADAIADARGEAIFNDSP